MKQKEEIEKRELLEQQQKIFEAGAQRADKRAGSFSFLTWPFFIAPLIAGEEFLSATLKAEAGEEEDGKATQASAALQAIDDELPARDPAKTGAGNELADGPAALSQVNTPAPDPTSVPAQPHEGAPKPSSAHTESFATAKGGAVTAEEAMMPIAVLMRLTAQVMTLTTAVPLTRWLIQPSEIVNCRMDLPSNPFSLTCLATLSICRSTTSSPCLEVPGVMPATRRA